MILIVNLGLKSIRAILFNKEGKVLSKSALPINTYLSEESVEQDPLEWKKKLISVLKSSLKDLSSNSKVEFLSVTCSSSCLISVDENNCPTRNAIMVSDKRSFKEASFIKNLNEYQTINKNNNFSISEYSQLSRLLWIKKNEPENFYRTKKFLSPNDFIISLLSNKYYTDALNAEKFFYSSEFGEYPEKLLRKIGIEKEHLPEVAEIGSDLGKISKEISNLTGLPSNTKIILSTYDAICSIFGSGLSSAGEVCDVSGTVTSVRMISKKQINVAKNTVINQFFSPSNTFIVGGSNNLGGGVIEWLKQSFYSEIEKPYKLMEKDFINSKTRRSNIIFLPHLLGSRSPNWDVNARAVFFGIERFHTRKDFIRSVFESIGYSILDFVKIFKKSGLSIDFIAASGGLAQIDSINQLKSNICNTPYRTLKNFESTSLGALFITLKAIGCYKEISEASKEIVEFDKIYEPELKHIQYYDDMYNLSKEISASLSNSFKKRIEIINKYESKNINHIENL